MSDNRFGVQFNPFAPLPEPEPEGGRFNEAAIFDAIQQGMTQGGMGFTVADPAQAKANADYFWHWMTQMPIRDAMAAGSQAFIDAPGSTWDATRAGFGTAHAYLQQHLPDYLRFQGPGGTPIPAEERPTQPGFASIFAQGREPLPAGVTPEEFRSDLMGLLENRNGPQAPEGSGGRGGVTPEGFAAKYGMDPSLDILTMAEQADLRYGDPAVPGAIADIAATAVDVFDVATRALGLVGPISGLARQFGPDDWLAIASPGSWYRRPTATRPGTPRQALEVYGDAVRRYETHGPSGSLSMLADDIQQFFRAAGADRVSIEPWRVGDDLLPSSGTVQVGDATVTFNFYFPNGPDGPGAFMEINTLHTSNPNGRSPHQLAALQPILEFADLNGITLTTYAHPFDHKAVSRAGLENIYNKLGFEYKDAQGLYGQPGSPLVRAPVTMADNDLRAAEYAARRNALVETRARFAARPPRDAGDILGILTVTESLPSGIRPVGGNFPTPARLAELTADDVSRGAVDDAVYALFRVLSDALDDADASYARYNTRRAPTPPDEFTDGLRSMSDAMKDYLRGNIQDADVLARAEDLVDWRMTESLGAGRLFDNYVQPPSGTSLEGLEGSLDRLRQAQAAEFDAATAASGSLTSATPEGTYQTLAAAFGGRLPAIPDEPMPDEVFSHIQALEGVIQARRMNRIDDSAMMLMADDARVRLERFMGTDAGADLYDTNPDAALYLERLLDDVLGDQDALREAAAMAPSAQAPTPSAPGVMHNLDAQGTDPFLYEPPSHMLVDDQAATPGAAFRAANPEAPEDIAALADSGRYDLSPAVLDGNRMRFTYTMRGTDTWPSVSDSLTLPDGSTASMRPTRYNPDIATPRAVSRDGSVVHSFDLADGWAARFDDLAVEDPSMMYRGMSWEEWQEAQRTGYIKSQGTYNIGEQQAGMTLYAESPGDAASYAGGFAPERFAPSAEKPGVVIAVPRRYGVAGAAPRGEIAIPDAIPLSEVSGVWEGHVYAARDDGYIDAVREWGDAGYSRGSATPLTSYVAWRQAGLPDWQRVGGTR